MQRRRKDKAMK